MIELVDSSRYPYFARIVGEILSQWPQHERYLRINIDERELVLLEYSEKLAAIICRISDEKIDGLAAFVADYRFLCQDIILPEELYFRRHGSYRLNNFIDAQATVYDNAALMARYMNGLLVSDLMWINHCRCMMHFSRVFLPSLPIQTSLLEIGPGNGLLLCLAAEAPAVAILSAWDVSDTSLSHAAATLQTIETERFVNFEKRNIFDDTITTLDKTLCFDAIVLSEVLEHLEKPLQAVEILYRICKPGGRVWINAPANSPAPDHLFLFNEPSEVAVLVRDAGFEVEAVASFPMSGTTLERAIRQKLTVNCVVIGRKPL